MIESQEAEFKFYETKNLMVFQKLDRKIDKVQ